LVCLQSGEAGVKVETLMEGLRGKILKDLQQLEGKSEAVFTWKWVSFEGGLRETQMETHLQQN